MIAMKNILVATDFGEAADTALGYGRELATRFGSTLHVTEKNGDELVFQLVMPEDADGRGFISTTSPIGHGCLNREVGDTVKVITPGGTREFEITKLLTIHDEAE